MFVPCIIRRSRNNQQYALICTNSLFYILAPTCFGTSLPLSGSFLNPSDLFEIQIEWVVYHIMCGYVACVLDCRGSVCCASQLSTYKHSVGKHNIYLYTYFEHFLKGVYKTRHRRSEWRKCIVRE
jgi:hypothetical protein